MTRVNIDDDLFADERFKIFKRIVGDEDKAVGMMVRLYKLGQSYWRNSKLIPEPIFVAAGFQPVLDCDLAERRGEAGIYVRGSDDRWDWLLAVEAKAKAAGRASAEARKKKYGTSNPKEISKLRRTHEQNPEQAFERSDEHLTNKSTNIRTKHEHLTNPLDIALALAPDIALVNNLRDSSESRTEVEVFKPKRPKKAVALKDRPETSQVWLAYVEAYKVRYGQEPASSAANYGICNRLIQRIGFEPAKQVVQFYLTHNNSWYVQKCHMLKFCLGDAEALLTQMQANFKVTNQFARDADKSQNNQQVFQEVLDLWNAKEEGGGTNEPAGT